MEVSFEVSLATWADFHSLPKTTVCVGVTKVIPEEFRTTSIRNFVYTPNSIISGRFPDDGRMSAEEFYGLYHSHVASKVRELGFHNIQDWLSQMLSEFDGMFGGEFDTLCFLGDNRSETDITHFLARLLGEYGVRVKGAEAPRRKELDYSLF